ncbi:aromatic ring-cleaving dioxygenase [Bradyrhizobium sp. USDA 4341]
MSFRSDQSRVVVPFASRRPAAVTPADQASLRPVLVVLHQETSTPGRIGNALRALGYPLDIRRPRFGDALPDTLEAHAGAVIFGGPMSANDPDDYVRREIDWISVPLREQRPFLGICLGAQMLARPTRRQGRAASARARRGRLLPDPADGGWSRAVPGLAGAGLSLAWRGLSIACGCGPARSGQ